MNDLHVISWNVTRRCNLECSHCYLPAVTRKAPCGLQGSGELSTREAFGVIDQIAEVNPEVMLILSGGEPLLRDDIFHLAAYANGRGMMVVLGSNGLLINDGVARKLKQSGVTGISISLDSIDPEVHDSVRSCPGAWKRTVDAIRICGKHGLSTQINTVVTRRNCDSMPALIDYCRRLGARVYSPFFLVCTGRGEELTDISPQQYEEILSLVADCQKTESGMMVRTRCAPMIRRILYGRNPDSPLLKMDTGRCLAGIRYCRISPEGDVTPCPYMTLSAGNVREKHFREIWTDSPLFDSLRTPAHKGRCGKCRFRFLCGGCRARAHAVHRDYLEEDPWCSYLPDGGDTVKLSEFDNHADTILNEVKKFRWTAEAEDRLRKVPFFVRNMVRAAVERYARENNCHEITPETMDVVKQKAMGGAFHGR